MEVIHDGRLTPRLLVKRVVVVVEVNPTTDRMKRETVVLLVVVPKVIYYLHLLFMEIMEVMEFFNLLAYHQYLRVVEVVRGKLVIQEQQTEHHLMEVTGFQ